jgi:predicted nucleic acid-binding protein
VILADTSIWIEHLRRGEPRLAAALDAGQVLAHPLVIGELAMGNLAQRALVLGALAALPQAVVAQHDEVMAFIEHEALHGLGVGFVDAHLLASTRLTPDARLYTRDRRLEAAAQALDLAAG